MKESKWVVYSWSADYPSYCAIKCVCDTEDEAKKHADRYDEVAEVEYFTVANQTKNG